MVPTALLIPAAIPPGMIGTLLDPAGVLTMLAAAVAAVAIGLGVAIASDRSPRLRPVRTLQRGSVALAS